MNMFRLESLHRVEHSVTRLDSKTNPLYFPLEKGDHKVILINMPECLGNVQRIITNMFKVL